MATTYHLNTTLASGAPSITDPATPVEVDSLSPTVDTNPVSTSSTCTASGNHILEGSGANFRLWARRVDAVTISGTINFTIYAGESLMTTNAQIAILVRRYNNSGTAISYVVDQANAGHVCGAEAGTSGAAPFSWSATPTSTSFSAGDWLAVFLHADASGTMGTGSLALYWGDATTDSLVTFTETIPDFGSSVSNPVHRSPMSQLLAH